jgi:hypothetical protein
MSATSPFHFLWRLQRLLGPGNPAKAPSKTKGSPADASSTNAGSPAWIPRLPAVVKERWLGFLWLENKNLVCIRNSRGLGGNFLWAGTASRRISYIFEPIRTQEFRIFSNHFELKKHFFRMFWNNVFVLFRIFLSFFVQDFRRTDIFFCTTFSYVFEQWIFFFVCQPK